MHQFAIVIDLNILSRNGWFSTKQSSYVYFPRLGSKFGKIIPVSSNLVEREIDSGSAADRRNAHLINWYARQTVGFN